MSGISGVGGGFSPYHVMSGASASATPAQKAARLFDSAVPSGSGSITKNEFQQAYQSGNPPANFPGVEEAWKALDPYGNGVVTKANFVQDMAQLMSAPNPSS
jgi:hypothetical protein